MTTRPSSPGVLAASKSGQRCDRSDVQADGTCWVGGTVWQGHTAMRISVSSWATTDDDVDRSLAAIVRAAKHVRGAAI